MKTRTILLVLPLALSVTSASAGTCDPIASDEKVALGERQTDLEAMKRLGLEAIVHCDTNARAHNLHGNALEALGDLAGADKAYLRAAELDPTWYVALVGLGDIARKRGATEEARSAYAKALGLAKTADERKQVESSSALLPPPPPSGYGFKDADAIERGFRIGERLTQATAGGASAEGGTAAAGGVGRSGGVVQDEATAPWTASSGAKPTTTDADIVQTPDGRIGSPLSVEFLVGSTTFTDSGRLQAEALATGLGRRRTGTERFVIEGHASTEGDDMANLELSKLRAAAFRDFLVAQGLDKVQFEVRGFGEAHPIIEGNSENKAKSRRVVLVRNADR
jgi:outer membrane protein OmpA-like peptidoglycan-associated protein